MQIGINENIIYEISKKRREPKWLLDFRLKSYYHLLTQQEPHWGVDYSPIDYSQIGYITEEEKCDVCKLNDELKQYCNKAVDIVQNHQSLGIYYDQILKGTNIIFTSIKDAVINHEDLIKEYLGKVVNYNDNFFATLNSAVFSDGTFCYIPKNVKCPIELSTFFHINKPHIGQFERTLIIVEEGAKLEYFEGCTAKSQDHYQLHSAVVEINVFNNASMKYSTIQNWDSGDENGHGGIYNFVTKRSLCQGNNIKMTWVQVEKGSSKTWKYPSTILKGDTCSNEFYSVSITNKYQEADTGTKIIHIGKNNNSKIISKSIALGHSKNTFRSLVKILPNSDNNIHYTCCDSYILSDNATVSTIPNIICQNHNSEVNQEAFTSTINKDILNFCLQRGMNTEKSISMIINSCCHDIYELLPKDYAMEIKKILLD